MRVLRSFFVRFVAVFAKQRRDRDLSDEIESHLQFHIDDNLRRGMSPVEARRRAVLTLGGVEQTKEIYRERRGLPMIETLLQDLRFGARMLRKSPGFTAVAVLTLALGIGANTAIFSIVNSILLRPLQYPDSGRLIRVYIYTPVEKGLDTTFAGFLDWRSRNRSFETLAAAWQNDSNLYDTIGPEKIRSACATADLFPMMGVRPVIGRLFRSTDDRVGYEHIVLLGYGIWQRRYGGDPAILGKQIQIDSTPYQVAGVLPRGFHYPGKTDVWMPMGVGEEFLIGFQGRRRIRAMEVIGRLKPEITLAHAEADMAVVTDQLAKEYPATDKDLHADLIPLEEDTVGASRQGLWILMGAAGFVMLIGCANLANLLLSRGAGRLKEFAIRGALGGSRIRLARQLVTESVLLAIAGGLAGIALAYLTQASILAIIPRDLPRLDEIHLDGHVLGFAFVLSLLTGVGFGLAPAWQAAKSDLQSGLKPGGRDSGGDSNPRLRKVLIAGEIACAFILLLGASLMMQSLLRLLQVRPGYNPQNLMTATIGFPDSYQTSSQKIRFAKQVIEDLRGIPGVRDVAGTSLLPLLSFKRQGGPVQINGEPPDLNHGRESGFSIVTPGFFSAMQIPLIAGRSFTEAEGGLTSGPLVISESAARNWWPGQNPLGKHLHFLWDDSQDREVIGVVGDVKQDSLALPSRPEIYVPFYGLPFPYITFVMRTEQNPESFGKTLVDTVHTVDSTMAVYDVQSLNHLISDSLNPNRFYLRLLGAFGFIAVALAATGVYGLISFGVGQRTREFGIRLALGALPREILRMILSQGLRLVFAGLIVGLLGSVALSRLIAGFLFGVQPTDPFTLVGSAAIIVFCALAACYIPARRATRVDPMVALRHE